MIRFLESFKDILFPPVCITCRNCLVDSSGSRVDLVCGECLEKHLRLSAAGPSRCRCCGYPVAMLEHAAGAELEFASSEKITFDCLECRRWGFRFSTSYCLGAYEGALQRMVLQAKLLSGAPIAYALGQLLGVMVGELEADMVLPVPMHWQRRLSRQWSTAELIGRGFASRTGLSLRTNLLQACRRTEKQGTLSPQQRLLNVRGAFRLRRRDLVQDRQVVLIDDVMTTGATLHEITTRLLQAGATRVLVAVICRAGWNESQV